MNNLEKKIYESRIVREKFRRGKKFLNTKEFLLHLNWEYKRWLSFEKDFKNLDKTHLQFYKDLYGNRHYMIWYKERINPLITTWIVSVIDKIKNDEDIIANYIDIEGLIRQHELS